jgi:hypothetical protein
MFSFARYVVMFPRAMAQSCDAVIVLQLAAQHAEWHIQRVPGLKGKLIIHNYILFVQVPASATSQGSSTIAGRAGSGSMQVALK